MNPVVIGLTGGVASGKSEAAAYLAERGAFVVDADKVAREVAGLPEIRRQLKTAWPQVFESDSLNRAALRKIIFSSREDREKLNGILHPPILNHLLRTVEACGEPVCVIMAPLLIESGLHQMVDEVWVMDVPPEVQLKRLMDRDGISREEGLKMIASQLSNAERLAHAHRIIDNGGPFEKTRELLEKEWQALGSERVE